MRSVAVVVALTTAPIASAQSSMFFDFGNTNLQTPGNWNNIVPATTTLNSLVDSDGNTVGSAGLTITDTLFQTGEPSQLGSESPSGDAAIFPVSATDDYFFGHTTPFAGADPNPLGVFQLFDLDDSLTYNFTFFASRQTVADTRDAEYSVDGLNSGSGVLNASNNDTEVLVIDGISPIAGVIDISVAPGPGNDNINGFFYIGAIRVDIIPAPTTSCALLGGLCFMSRRRR